MVTLTAIPDKRYVFVEWAGDLAGNDESDINPYEIVITQSLSVSAVFKKDQGLPARAWAGIGVGVLLAAVGLTYLGVILRRRARRTRLPQSQ
ncbi:MAG: hypothetical protein FJ020_05675 [Chloroflexi bacterium]|nr:hypothetical protein [Chloroflexota bacterium]